MSSAREGSVVVAINALWHREHTLTWPASHAYELGAPIHIVGCVTRADFQDKLPFLKATLLRDIASVQARQPDLAITHSLLTDVTADALTDIAHQCGARSLILAPALTMQPETTSLIEDVVHGAPCKVVVLPNTMRAEPDWPVVTAVEDPADGADASVIACRYAETRDLDVTLLTRDDEPNTAARRTSWWQAFLRPRPDSPSPTATDDGWLDRLRTRFPHVALHRQPVAPNSTYVHTALALKSSMLVTTLKMAEAEADHRPPPTPLPAETVVMQDFTDAQCEKAIRLGFLLASGRPTVFLPEIWRLRRSATSQGTVGTLGFESANHVAS